jgi:shikimate kinase
VSPIAVLVGAPGAGKTTVGRLLAAHLNVPFADTDAAIEAKAGKPIPEIFFDDGEPAFRALEAATVADALTTHPGILALGGGAVLDPATRALLRTHRVVYLFVTLPEAAKRVGLNRDRPLLLGNVRTQLKTLLEARTPLYEEVATLTIPTNNTDPETIADTIAAKLQ